MNKNNIVIGLGSITTIIGAWFFITEYNYAISNVTCQRSYKLLPIKPCLAGSLAETLQWVGIAQVLAGLAIVYIGLILKENKGTN